MNVVGMGSPMPVIGVDVALSTGKQKNVTFARSGYQKPTSSALAIGANTGMNMQQKFLFVEPVNKVRFTYGDTRNASPDNETSPSLVATGDAPPPISVTASSTVISRVYWGTAVDSGTALFLPGATSGAGWNSAPVLFFGKTSEITMPGTWLVSDWVNVPAGTNQVIVKSWTTWTGSLFGMSYGVGNYNSPGAVFWTEASAFDTVDKTVSALTFGMYNDGSGGRGRGAAYAEGITDARVRDKVLIGVNGDSRFSQAILMNATGGGMFAYNADSISMACAINGYSHSNITVAQSSERQLDLVASRWHLRSRVASMADYVVIQLGFNDLAAGTAAMYATLRLLKARINAQGARMIVLTIYPNTTSSNTVKGSFDATRVAYNTYVRSAAAKGDIHDGYMDFAYIVETDAPNKSTPVMNGGYFMKFDGVFTINGYTPPAGDIYGDGTHMSSTGNLAAAYYLAPFLNTVMPKPTSLTA